MNVLSFDPGGHTGIAQRVDGAISTGVALSPEEVVAHIKAGHWDRIIYERFASSVATSHDAIYTIEMCGLIQGIAMALGIPLVRHEPANRKAFLKKAKDMVVQLRHGANLGPWAVHEIDALAHLFADDHFGDEIAGPRSTWGKGLSTHAS